MLNSSLSSGKVGAKKEKIQEYFASTHVLLEKRLFLGSSSVVLVQFSCPEVNPNLAFEKTSVSTLFTSTLDGRNCFQPRLHGGSAVDAPVLWKLQIKVIIETYFDCSQVI